MRTEDGEGVDWMKRVETTGDDLANEAGDVQVTESKVPGDG